MTYSANTLVVEPSTGRPVVHKPPVRAYRLDTGALVETVYANGAGLATFTALPDGVAVMAVSATNGGEWVVGPVSGGASGSSVWTVSGADVYRPSGNVGIGVVPTYKIDTGDTTDTARIGHALIGAWPAATSYALFGHASINQSAFGNYAVIQNVSGGTILNSAAGQPLAFRINNEEAMVINTDKVIWFYGNNAVARTIGQNPGITSFGPVSLGAGVTIDVPIHTGVAFLRAQNTGVFNYYNQAVIACAWDGANGPQPVIVGQAAAGGSQAFYTGGVTGLACTAVGGSTGLRIKNNFGYPINLSGGLLLIGQ